MPELKHGDSVISPWLDWLWNFISQFHLNWAFYKLLLYQLHEISFLLPQSSRNSLPKKVCLNLSSNCNLNCQRVSCKRTSRIYVNIDKFLSCLIFSILWICQKRRLHLISFFLKKQLRKLRNSWKMLSKFKAKMFRQHNTTWSFGRNFTEL